MDRNKISQQIKKSIYQGYWLYVIYKNKQEEETKYWIDIKDIQPNGKMTVNGFYLSGEKKPEQLFMYFDRIKYCNIVEGSYHEKNTLLIDKLEKSDSFKFLDAQERNLKILDYYVECNLYDTRPYQSNYKLIEDIDDKTIPPEGLILTEKQFIELVKKYRYKNEKNKVKTVRQDICLNLLSIDTAQGLYVLAYRNLRLDVIKKMLVPEEDIIINYEFIINNGEIEKTASISQFLSEEDKILMEDYTKNAEDIRNRIMEYRPDSGKIIDTPYIVFLERNIGVDLQKEYEHLNKNFIENTQNIPAPIRVFFGEQANKTRRKPKPIILFDPNKINLDQLLVINKAMKNDVTYVQGPPGTGKTNTILSVILTAFFNDMSVLITSYNNHPMDGIYNSLFNLKSFEKNIPLPVVRLGNKDSVAEALSAMKKLYDKCQNVKIYEGALSKSRDQRVDRVKGLTDLLENYENKLSLLEKKATLDDIVKNYSREFLNVTVNIQTKQLKEVDDKLAQIGDIDTANALEFLDKDTTEINKFLFYKSAENILKLRAPKNKELLAIIDMPADSNDEVDKKVSEFNKYLGESENLRNFIKIFPIVITTNSSSYHLGGPYPHFDLTIMDEASQCNSAISLLPIMRGKRLLLVGDPQQLNPVILLDPRKNQILKNKYKIQDEYDYISKSIYKSFLAVDPISDEILLSYHYRCNPKIIEFNNRKFYNGKLNICSKANDPKPLVFIDNVNSEWEGKNTSISEVQSMLEYIKANADKSIGIITPFVKQKELIDAVLEKEKIKNITCGTVHAFQGDEKDVILFSTTITKNTHLNTYGWLKNNTELINVATSRAKDKLIILADKEALDRLHIENEKDDFFELSNYVYNDGEIEISSSCDQTSRALVGYKTYATQTEIEFMENLEHALGVINKRCSIKHNVGIKDVFIDAGEELNLFFTGHFDFIVYKKGFINKREVPCIGFELNGPEHDNDEKTIERDKKKIEIARKHGFTLITVKNTYSRRYNFIKSILEEYMK